MNGNREGRPKSVHFTFCDEKPEEHVSLDQDHLQPPAGGLRKVSSYACVRIAAEEDKLERASSTTSLYGSERTEGSLLKNLGLFRLQKCKHLALSCSLRNIGKLLL